MVKANHALSKSAQKYNKTLNVRSLGKPVSFVFPRLRLGKHQYSRENKTNCFPRHLTLSVYCFLFFCDNCRTEVCCFVCLFVCFFFSFNYSLPHMDMRYDSGVHMHVIRNARRKKCTKFPNFNKVYQMGFQNPFLLFSHC